MEEQFENLAFDPLDLQIRAAIMSIDKEKRTFEMVLATETPVRAFDHKNWEVVDQILTCTAEAADLTRIVGSGVGFFEIHPSLVYNSETSKNNQLGKIEAVRFDNGKCIASVRMSTRPNDMHLQDVWHDIQDGIRTSVSIGFVPLQVTRIETEDGKRNQMIVDRWELMEGSLADVAAAPDTAIQRSAPKPDDFQTPSNAVQVRSAITKATPAPVPAPIENRNSTKSNMTPEEIAALQAREAATAAENAKLKRDNEVRSIVQEINTISNRSAGVAVVDADREAQFLASDKPANEIRKETLRMFAELDPSKGAGGGARNAGSDREQFTTRAQNALYLRADALTPEEITPAVREGAREFMGMTDIRLFEEFARREGYEGHDAQRIFEAAMQKPGASVTRSGGSMTTGDLPSLLENVLNKRLVKQLTVRKPTWEEWVDVDATFTDFKPKKTVSLGDMPPLLEMAELDDYTYGTTTDSAETYQVGRFGRGIQFSFEMVVNNELGGILNRTPRGFAQRISQKRNESVYNTLIANAAMADGIALFHASHGNLCTAAALNATTFNLAKQKMRAQKSLGTANDPGQFLNLQQKYLIVGPLLETTALTLMNGQFVPGTLSDINTAKGQAVVIVDPLIEDSSWYLAGDYMDCDHLVMGFMAGWDLGIRMQRNWKNDAYQFHVSEIHGVGVLDYRNLVYTPSV